MKKMNFEKPPEPKASKKEFKKIRFELSKNALDCFISKKSETAMLKSSKTKNPKEQEDKQEEDTTKKLRLHSARNKAVSMIEPIHSIFNNQVLLLEYAKEEVYTDALSTEGNKRSKTPSPDHNQPDQFDFLGPCVRVITEETNCTSSNPISARHSYANLVPINHYQDYRFCQQNLPMETVIRNKRAISLEESREFVIEIDKVQQDGRLTIMVRNIPIKYTQEMLMELFSGEEKIQKFDFFYLPIDSKNSCNVGYAFLNFLHPKFIKDFYYKFHGNKWERFNSKKIIQVCYARIQGTAQLACHFENSKVLQKDKKVRPIGLNQSDHAHLSSLVQKQKTKI